MSDFFLFALFLILTIIFLPLILYKGLFTLPVKKEVKKAGPSFLWVLFAFFSYIVIAGFVPVIFALYFQKIGMHSFYLLSLIQLLCFFLILAVLFSSLKLIPIAVTRKIIGKIKPQLLLKGIGLTLLAYPIVMLIAQLIHVGLEYIGVSVEENQVAVSQMKELQSYPFLFWCYAVAIITLIPCIEELLFRGFLQNFLVDLMGRQAGVIIASFIFAGFHFALSQGFANLELLIGLFCISYLIGVSYMKSESLLVPIGMHGMFNGLSFAFMFLF